MRKQSKRRKEDTSPKIQSVYRLTCEECKHSWITFMDRKVVRTIPCVCPCGNTKKFKVRLVTENEQARLSRKGMRDE